jgi:hypothetical protein
MTYAYAIAELIPAWKKKNKTKFGWWSMQRQVDDVSDVLDAV